MNHTTKVAPESKGLSWSFVLIYLYKRSTPKPVLTHFIIGPTFHINSISQKKG